MKCTCRTINMLIPLVYWKAVQTSRSVPVLLNQTQIVLVQDYDRGVEKVVAKMMQSSWGGMTKPLLLQQLLKPCHQTKTRE